MQSPTTRPASPAEPAGRLQAVDSARGLAVLAMVAYHLCWDLDHFGFARFALTEDALWLAARAAIVSAFLGLSGVGLVLGTADGIDPGRVGRRLIRVGAAAAAVSAVSYVGFPESPIFFGVLHHLALAGVVGLAFLGLPAAVLAVLGAAVVALPAVLEPLPLFDAPWLVWLGLSRVPPVSNDFVPVFPWFGVVLLGMAAARWWRPRRRGAVPEPGPEPEPRARAGRPGWLPWAGRHSLPIYLLHQPVLFAALWLVTATVATPDHDTADFLASCRSGCTGAGSPEDACNTTCSCIVTDLRNAGLWKGLLAGTSTARESERVAAVIAACRPPGLR